MANQFKSCLIFPPQWTPFNPYFALYTLAGHLKSKKINIDIHDTNLRFYHHIMSAGYIQQFKKDILTYYEELTTKGPQNRSDKESHRHKVMQQLIFKEKILFDNLDANVEEAKQALKNPDIFYDPTQLIQSSNKLEYYFKLLSVPYYPAAIYFSYYQDPRYKMNLESLIEIIESEENFFEEYTQLFFEQELANNQYDYIALSINTDSQVLSGLLLAYKLKKHYGSKVHINIGGNYFTRLTEVIESKPEFFHYFADSMISGEGEVPIEKLITVLSKGNSLDTVPNLTYYDHETNTIKTTEEQPWLKNLDVLGKLDLSQIPINDYFLPEITLPIQLTRGCYWGKCSFCDHFYGPKVGHKSQDRLLDEVKEALSYGINKFVFVDEMLSPSMVTSFANKVLEEKLDIQWFTNFRTENGFTQEILDLAYKSGLRLVMWGVESKSDRILKAINKGIDLEHRFEVLERSDKANIWNFAFIFFGFPTETIEEAFETIKCVSMPKYHIDSYGKSIYTPGKQSAIVQHYKDYGISELNEDDSEFATWYNYKTITGMNSRSISKVAKLCSKFYILVHKNQPPLWFKFTNRDILFLYICHYGKKQVKKWHFKAIKDLHSIHVPPRVIEK